MWKAGNVINRIGNNPPAVLIFDPETDSDIGEARTIEAARLMAAAPAMLAALRDVQSFFDRMHHEGDFDPLTELQAKREAVQDAIAAATGER
jgi:hypothetical protein